MAAFLGMRGTGDWITNQRPENFRETILYLYPNGSAPLTAILSMMGSEQVNDPTFHWFTKSLPDQGGAITDIYSDAALSSAISTSAFASGTTLYVKMAEALSDEFRVGHVAMFQLSTDFNYRVVGEVTGVSHNGANSYAAVKLLERAGLTYPVASTDIIDVIGNSNEEGATMPPVITYDPTEFSNNCQIFRTPLSITRTARRTRLRTGDAYTEAKRQALELHAIEMEKAFLFSVKSSGVGGTGKPKRTTDGVIKFIQTNSSGTVDDFRSSAGFGGKAWLASGGGEKWLNEQLEVIFRFGNNEKLGLIGNRALLGLQELAQNTATVNITPITVSYGIKVLEWVTPFGTLFLKTHPLMSTKTALRNDLLIVEPEKLKYRYIDDTFFVEDPMDQKNRNNSRDGTEEEYITESGLEIHHPSAMGYLSGLGLANTSA